MNEQDRTPEDANAEPPVKGSASTPAENPTPRPAPQYGEYAPEGWTWSPEGADTASDTSADTTSDTATQTAGAGAPGAAASGSNEGGSNAAGSTVPNVGPIPGVPHNLGAAGQSSRQAAQATPPPSAPSQSSPSRSTPSTPGSPEPYRSTQAPGSGQVPSVSRAQLPAEPVAGASYGGPAAQAPANRSGDRIATILLLVLGALGALYFAASLYQMPTSLAMVGGMLGAEDLAIPSSVTVLGNVGAILLLALYALTLIYSLQRVRARKLAFWVPLAAGALAIIITLVFTMIGMTQVPELMTLLSDPESTTKLLGG